MLLLGLSLFDTGLMITIVTLLVLYLIVLIKLKPSKEGKKILESSSTEPRSNLQIYNGPTEDAEETEFVEEPEPALPPVKTEVSKETRNSGCPYHFGYLREHPKNTPIPNECLTCTKIMECLSKVE